MKNLEENWTNIVYQFGEQPLGIDALRKLTENQYAAIVIKNVLNKENLENSIEAARINLGKALKGHCFVFKPQAGDIYLFNSINYHEVDQTSGQERIVLRFFLGLFDENLEDSVIWS